MMPGCWQTPTCWQISTHMPLRQLDGLYVYTVIRLILLRVNLQSPFRNTVLTAQMEAYNEAMSSVRSSVEWLFGDTVNYFKFLDVST